MRYGLKYLWDKLRSSSFCSYIRFAMILRQRTQYYASAILRGYISFPPNIYIFVTNRCNYKCVMCDFSNKKRGYFLDKGEEDIDLDTWKRFIDSIAWYKPAIFFPAPEPFLYPDFIPLCNHVKSRGLFLSIATNGSLLGRHTEEIVDMGLDVIELSCDGTEAIHDKIRGIPGAFNNLVSVIKDIDRLKGKRNNPAFTITFTITHLNYSNILKTLEAIDALGVRINVFTISHLSYIPEEMAALHNAKDPVIKIHAHTYSHKVICPQIDIDRLFDELDAVRGRVFRNIDHIIISPVLNREEGRTWYNSPSQLDLDSRCFFPWLTANINFNGNVVLSPLCGPSFGNIKKEPFAKIWNNKKYRDIRVRLNKDKSYKPCFGCCSIRTF